MGLITDQLVVSNIGDPSKELYHVNDRSRNFYMLGSMGLASSISLGLSMSQSEKVVCLEGDGSLLMNLGSLATIANHSPQNLILILLDNGAYGTTGNQASFTSQRTNLEKVANACGIPNTYTAFDESGLTEIFEKCLRNEDLSFMHVLIKPDDEKMKPIPLSPVTIKERFMAAL